MAPAKKENTLIEDRIAEGLEQAKKVVLLLKSIGIPNEFGFFWNHNGAEFIFDKINQFVTVKMGPNYQLVVSLVNEEVTVYKGQTWIGFLDEAFDANVKGKEDRKNPSEYKILINLGLQ
jgi:hypothetical protein